jgi:hypothetical protein
MTIEGPFRIFTCDRCGTMEKHDTDALTSQPVGWMRITISAPVLASPVEDKKAVVRQACAECVPGIEAFLLGQNIVT